MYKISLWKWIEIFRSKHTQLSLVNMMNFWKHELIEYNTKSSMFTFFKIPLSEQIYTLLYFIYFNLSWIKPK